MRWIAQVGHVAAKDVRQARWVLIAYLAILSVAAASVVTGRAFGPYSTAPSNQIMGMPDVFVVYLPAVAAILGLIVTASLLQADSPTRANAFWASRPLASSAVLSAKLVVVAIATVALSLAAGFVALRALDTNSAAEARLLARAALSYGEWALAVMIVAALTDDMRSFVGVFVGILAALTVVVGALGEFLPTGASFAPLVLLVVGIGGGISLVVFLYRTRERHVRTWIAGVVACACLVLASFMTPPIPAGDVATGGPPVEIDPINSGAWSRSPQISMRLRVAQGSPTERLDFQPDSVAFQLSGGAEARVNGNYYSTQAVRGLLPPVGRAVRWIIDQPHAEWPATIDVQPHDADRAAIAHGVQSVRVAGKVIESRARVVASLPLHEHAAVTSDGRRVAIYGFSHNSTSAEVWIQLSVVPRAVAEPEPNPRLSGADGLQFAIVNDARAEAMLLEGVGDGSGGSGSIVLPWLGITTTFQHFTTNASAASASAFPRDSAWYAGARLVAVEWSVVGRYRARGEALLPPRNP